MLGFKVSVKALKSQRSSEVSGEYCNVPIAGWDIFPTVSEIIGNPNKLSSEFDGGSLVSVFKNGNSGSVSRNTEAFIFHFPWFNGEPESAIRLGNYKLIKNIDSRKTWLFDVVNDIEEANDLAPTMPEKANKLEEILTRYLEQVDAEHVMDLREKRRKEMLKSISEEEERLIQIREDLEKARGLEKVELEARLAKTKNYLKWLKGEVVFTDETAKLHL